MWDSEGHNNEGFVADERLRSHPETPMSPAAFGKKPKHKQLFLIHR